MERNTDTAPHPLTIAKWEGQDAAQAHHDEGTMTPFIEARSKMRRAADAGLAYSEKFWQGYMLVAHAHEARR